jgi:hypothetical protein
LFRYDLGFPPSVQPLTDAKSDKIARRMRRELEGYVQSALHDLTTHQAGPVASPAAAGGASVAVPLHH